MEDSVAFEAAVPHDGPVFGAGEGVFDAGADSLVNPVEVVLSGFQLPANGFAVRHDHIVTLVASVGHDRGGTGGGLDSGLGVGA